MKPEAQAAFVDSYGTNVAHYPADTVEDFVARYEGGEDIDYSPEYTSIVDALGIWHDAVNFAQQQQNKNFLICLRQLQDMTDNNHAYDPLTNESFNIAEQLAILEKAAS